VQNNSSKHTYTQIEREVQEHDFVFNIFSSNQENKE